MQGTVNTQTKGKAMQKQKKQVVGKLENGLGDVWCGQLGWMPASSAKVLWMTQEEAEVRRAVEVSLGARFEDFTWVKRPAKPYVVKGREEGRGRWSVERFATLAEASRYIQDRWQGFEYKDGPDGFHTDYCEYVVEGFVLSDIGSVQGSDETMDWVWTFFPMAMLEGHSDKLPIVAQYGSDFDTHHFRATRTYVHHCMHNTNYGWVDGIWIDRNELLGVWTDEEYLAKFGKAFVDDGFVAKTVEEAHADHKDPQEGTWCPLCQKILAERQAEYERLHPEEQVPF